MLRQPKVYRPMPKLGCLCSEAVPLDHKPGACGLIDQIAHRNQRGFNPPLQIGSDLGFRLRRHQNDRLL